MSKLAIFARTVRGWLARLPFKPLLLVTLGCLIIQEEYPFSDFPMYSSFGESTYYVYLADGHDQPLPTYEAAGMSTPTLKKVFANELRQERRRVPAERKRFMAEHKRAAAERVLTRVTTAARLRTSGNEMPEAWRLYEVNIALANGRYEKQSTLLAEIR